jgi:glycosyltransferase involved in cell wall biosynthesis
MKKALIFCSDVPSDFGIYSAGGMRSAQLINSLKKCGCDVSFAFNLDSYLAKKNMGKINSALSQEDLWVCKNFFNQELVINKIKPEITIWGNINTFNVPAHMAFKTRKILDLCGPINLERLYIDRVDKSFHAMRDEHNRFSCQISQFDNILCATDRQRIYFSSFLLAHPKDNPSERIHVLPICLPLVEPTRVLTEAPSLIYFGAFYPWQDPFGPLFVAARALEALGGTLEIFGTPHAGLPNYNYAFNQLSRLDEFQSVKLHGYVSFLELRKTLLSSWASIELMNQNFERELALTGRSIESLANGVPIIYNNYSTLSANIEENNAGWTVDPLDNETIHSIISSFGSSGFAHNIIKLSKNAFNLATNNFSQDVSDSIVSDILSKIQHDSCGFSVQDPMEFSSKNNNKSCVLNFEQGINVLAITADAWALKSLRMSGPLESLKRQGLINSFRVISGYNQGNPQQYAVDNDQTRYNVIIIQRDCFHNLFYCLDVLGLPFILDIDDLLVANAGYRNEECDASPVGVGLSSATAVSLSTSRLMHNLEKYTGISISAKSFITPNSLLFPATPKTPIKPASLILIQSDTIALTDSRESILQAIEHFSKRHCLPIYTIGPQQIDFLSTYFTNIKNLGKLSFQENLDFLNLHPTAIGLAPLETAGDVQTLDFVNSKSDLKMLLFGGFGHPSIYSNACPYTDSDLKVGMVTDNSYDAWSENLEYIFNCGYKNAASEQSSIISARHIDLVSRNNWLELYKASVFRPGITISDIFSYFSRVVLTAGHTSRQNLRYIFSSSQKDIWKNLPILSSHFISNHFAQYGFSESHRSIDPINVANIVTELEKSFSGF